MNETFVVLIYGWNHPVLVSSKSELIVILESLRLDTAIFISEVQGYYNGIEMDNYSSVEICMEKYKLR